MYLNSKGSRSNDLSSKEIKVGMDLLSSKVVIINLNSINTNKGKKKKGRHH